VPDNVDVYPREGEHGKVFILVNFAKFQQTITLPKDMQNVLEGTTVKSVTLPVYGVAVLSDPK
jgi:hypothetical protein